MNRFLKYATIVAFLPALSMTRSKPVMAQPKLVKTTVTYREVDGHSILADVYRPEGNKRSSGDRLDSRRSADYGAP